MYKNILILQYFINILLFWRFFVKICITILDERLRGNYMKEIKEFKYRDKGKDPLLNQHHYHNNCLEILHIISGTGVMVIKDKLYPFEAGSVFFINGKNAHCSVPELPENYIRNKIIFSKNYIEKILLHTNCIIWFEKLFNEYSKK